MYKHFAESILETPNKRFISQSDKDRFDNFDSLFREKSDTYSRSELECFLNEFNSSYLPVEGSYLSLEKTKYAYMKNVKIIGNTIQDSNNLSDIKSVGDLLENGRYKIPISVKGKNILNFDDFNRGSVSSDGLLTLQSDSLNIVSNIICRSVNSISISFKEDVYELFDRFFVLKYDSETGKYVESEVVNTITSTLTWDKNYDIRIQINNISDDNIQILKDMTQIEIGNKVTDFEHYVGEEFNIITNTPLEKVGSVCDMIVKKDGIWGVEKNIKTIQLTGYEDDWQFRSITGDEVNGKYEIVLPFTGKENTIGYISSYIVNDDRYSIDFRWVEGVRENTVVLMNTFNIPGYIQLAFVRGKGEFDTIEGCLKFIRENPLILKVPSKEVVPEFIPLSDEQQVRLRTFDGITNISILSEINGKIKGEVCRTLASSLDLQMDVLTELSDIIGDLETVSNNVNISEIKTKYNNQVIENTGNGYLDNLQLEGDSIINHCKYEFTNNSHTLTEISNGFLKASINTTDSLCSNIFFKKPSTIKNSQLYTIIVNIVENTLTNNQFLIINADDLHGADCIFNTFGYIEAGFTGPKVYTTISREDISNLDVLLRSYIYTDNDYTPNYVKLSVMVLEGDHTDKSISYFEGLKSVGDGTDLIKITSYNNGNLLSNNLYNITQNAHIHWATGMIVENSTGFIATDFINLPISGKLHCKNCNLCIAFYDKYKNYIYKPLSTDGTDLDYYTDIPPGAEYFRISIPIANLNIASVRTFNDQSENDLQFDVKNLLYIDPVENVYMKPVLRSLPNGLKDTVEKHSDGKYYYHKRCGGVILNGSEVWIENGWDSSGNTIGFEFNTSEMNFTKNKTMPVISAEFSTLIPQIPTDFNLDKEFITQYPDSNSCGIKILKSRLLSTTLEGFKEWLSTNNFEIVYALNNEEVYECTPITLNTYDGNTIYSISSGYITPKSNITLKNGISSTVAIICEKLDNIENILYNNIKYENKMMLYSMYSTDIARLKSDISLQNQLDYSNSIDLILYSILLDIISVGKENYKSSEMENIIDFYTMIGKLSFEMADELLSMVLAEE